MFGEALGYVPASTRHGEGGLVALEDGQLALADGRFGVRRRVALADGRLAWAYLDPKPFAAAKKVAVLGDSIAFGMSDPSGGWAARLAGLVPRLWNLAIPGETMARLATYGPGEATRRDVDTAVVSAGGNDIAGGAEPEQVLAHLEAIVAPLEAACVRVVALGPTWMDADRAEAEFGLPVRTDALERLRTLMVRWGERTHRDVIDLWEPLRGRTAPPSRATPCCLASFFVSPIAQDHGVVDGAVLRGVQQRRVP